jgi:hypothetical protein
VRPRSSVVWGLVIHSDIKLFKNEDNKIGVQYSVNVGEVGRHPRKDALQMILSALGTERYSGLEGTMKQKEVLMKRTEKQSGSSNMVKF